MKPVALDEAASALQLRGLRKQFFRGQVIDYTIDTIPNIGIGNANVNGNNPRFAYP